MLQQRSQALLQKAHSATANTATSNHTTTPAGTTVEEQLAKIWTLLAERCQVNHKYSSCKCQCTVP